MIRPLLLLAVAATGPADTQRDLDAALAGRRVAGKPARCLTSSHVAVPQMIGDRTLLYHDGTRLWRNDLPAACPGLDRDPIIVNEPFGGQLCRGDTFYTVARGGGIPGPRCRLGDFVPWERVKR